MHALAPAFGVGGFTLAAGQVILAPGVEPGQVDEVIAHHLEGIGHGLVAKPAEEQGVVHAAALHALQQALHQGHVTVLGCGEAQAPTHQIR